MKKSALTPTRLRIMLLVCMLLLVTLGVCIFLFGYGRVTSYAKEAQATATQATASNNSLQTLMTTKEQLAKNADAVKRADQLVAESKSYVYQDQIITDLNQYAREAGIGVTNITFTDTKTTPVTTTTPAATSSSSATSSSTGTAASSTATPAGIKSMTATVTLTSPVDYNNMLTFIYLIEQSLFRMQISQISLSRGSENGDSSSNKVTSDTLTIEVYVR